MPYDAKTELKKVRDHYHEDPLQKRFSALVTGESGSGKSFLVRTCRKPIHIDSFDPGGTKCLRDLIDKGDIIADTSWEREDPYDPKRFGEWMKAVDIRLQTGYFEMFQNPVFSEMSVKCPTFTECDHETIQTTFD